jgi:hypothetical protein
MDSGLIAASNSLSITHLANCPSLKLPTIFSDEPFFYGIFLNVQ